MSENKLIEIDPCREPAWNEFIERHPFGLIYHLAEWKRLIENCFGHMKGHYFVLNGGDGIKAALPVYEVKSWIFGNRLVSIPFATICDPLVSSRNEYEILFGAVKDLFRDLNASYIEIRALNSTGFINQSRGSSSFKCHFLNLETDLKTIEKNFHHSLRQKLRKVGRSALNLKTGEDEKDLREFYRLNVMTRKRLGLPPQPFKFFKMLWDIFYPDKIRLLIAEHQEKAIAAVILYIFKDRVSAEFTATDWNCIKVNPVHFLYWEIIKWAHSSGYKVFDLGRTDTGNDGLMSFKNSWGMEMIDIPQYYYPVGKRIPITGSFIHKVAETIFSKSPDFAARILGNICYAHIG
jgi:hypothetical protein